MRNLSLKRSSNLLKMNWVSCQGMSESNIYELFFLSLCFSLNFLFSRLLIGLSALLLFSNKSVLLLFSNNQLLVLLIESTFLPLLLFSTFIFIDLFLQLSLNLCCSLSTFLGQCLENLCSKHICLRR